MFQLTNPELAQRLDEFRQADETSLSDEIALTRLLAEAAVNEGHAGLAGQLLHVVGKLQLLQVAQQEKMGNLLGRHALFAVGSAICEAIVQRLSGLPNYEQIVDLVIPAIESAIATAGREHHANRCESPKTYQVTKRQLKLNRPDHPTAPARVGAVTARRHLGFWDRCAGCLRTETRRRTVDQKKIERIVKGITKSQQQEARRGGQRANGLARTCDQGPVCGSQNARLGQEQRMKAVQTKVTRLNSPDYEAFKQSQQQKAQAHAAVVREVRLQSQQAAKQRGR